MKANLEFDSKNALIQSLFAENVGQHLIHNAIAQDLSGVYTNESCYITELLQNANDVSASDFNMKFVTDVNGNFLMYTNTGDPFEADHVRRICNYSIPPNSGRSLLHSEDKCFNISKTGHKDVGFKTVFKIADCAYICSNGYQFRFEENYPWKRKLPVPWMITPIPTADHEFPEVARPLLHSNQTVFVFRIKPIHSEKLVVHLSNLHKRLELFLFLDKIKSIRICYPVDSRIKNIRILRDQKENDISLISSQELVPSQFWLMHAYEKKIPEKICSELQQMDQYVCPEKVRSQQKVTISFAIRVERDGDRNPIRVLPIENTSLYT
ncbi:MAG: hypothetical protein M3R00_09950, partial [Pseudomonadota bacterium]|nr:hypothetical protein [Pseudomonadota bacterium]